MDQEVELISTISKVATPSVSPMRSPVALRVRTRELGAVCHAHVVSLGKAALPPPSGAM